MILRDTFIHLVKAFSVDLQLPEALWQEIENAYSDRQRHYHTLAHLENLLRDLTPVKEQIQDWEAVLFALFYHDIVYKATGKGNEEKSAELARKRLESLSFPPERTARCVAHILATKGHTGSNDPDTDLFTDADLSVLGKDENAYKEYYQQVRKEYAIYPDLLYKPGRKKVLQHFLSMERIFKTPHFFDLYEQQAHKNLQAELRTLKN